MNKTIYICMPPLSICANNIPYKYLNLDDVPKEATPFLFIIIIIPVAMSTTLRESGRFLTRSPYYNEEG